MPNDLPYEYVNEDSIPHTLKCGICRQPFIRPVSTKCRKQHKFCRDCIEQWLKNHSTCPTCRQNLTKDDLMSVKEDIVIELLDELYVKCSTCKETNIERVHFVDHLKNVCSMEVMKCPAHDIQCSWQGYQYELESHVQQCSFQALRPLLVSLIDENRALKAQINEYEGHVHRYENQVSQLHVQTHQQTNQIQRQHLDILDLQNQLRYNRHQRPSIDSKHCLYLIIA